MTSLSVLTACTKSVTRSAIVTRARYATLLAIGFASALPAAAPAQDISAYEHRLQETVQAACHSFMVDALPEALSWLKESIYQNSPFCQRMAAAGDLEEFGETLQAEYSTLGPNDTRLDLTKRVDRDLQVTIECDSDYMCMETRLRFQGTATPISQEAYDTVRQYCDGRYGCIEAYFRDWPVPLPTKQQIASTQIFRFEEVIPAPGTAASPAVEEAAPAKEQTAEKQTAKAVAAAPTETATATPPAPVTQPVPAPQEPQAEEQPVAAQPLVAANPETLQKIAQLAQQTRQMCACSLSGRECNDNPFGPVRESVARVEAQRRQYCQAVDGVSDTTALNQSEAEAALARLKVLHNGVLSADRRAYEIIALAEEDFERIQLRVRNNLPFVPTLEEDRIAALAADPDDLPTAPSSTVPSPTTSAQAPGATTTAASPGFVMGPRQGWQQATSYCARQGMRLPTVDEARALIPQLPDEDWYFGLWTSQAAYVDAYVQRYETMRPNGRTEGENATWEARVACIK